MIGDVRWFTDWLSGIDEGDGLWFIKNHKTGTEFKMNERDLIDFIRRNAPRTRLAIGDKLHVLFKRIGFSGDCLPCAERQAWLNKL